MKFSVMGPWRDHISNGISRPLDPSVIQQTRNAGRHWGSRDRTPPTRLPCCQPSRRKHSLLRTHDDAKQATHPGNTYWFQEREQTGSEGPGGLPKAARVHPKKCFSRRVAGRAEAPAPEVEAYKATDLP